jgi:hypothetical protein
MQKVKDFEKILSKLKININRLVFSAIVKI